MNTRALALTVLLCLALAVTAEARSKRKPAGQSSEERFAADLAATPDVPRDEEVCFSPDEPCAAKLYRLIASAKRTIDIAIYDLNIRPLIDLLKEKHSKGVAIRVVVDQRQSKGDHSLVGELAPIVPRFGCQGGIMHDKFTIVDGAEPTAMLETGSFNYTNPAQTKNQENQIYLAKPKVIERYTRRYDKIWNASKADGESCAQNKRKPAGWRGRRSK